MNDAQPRPSETDSPDGTQHAAGGKPGGDAPVLTRQIPPPIEMVTLLGPRDELLRTMERQFPLVDTHVRGNEMTFAGPAGELEIIDSLLDELLVIVETGQPLNRDAVERSISMLRSQTLERPADVLTMNIVSSRGRTIRPKTLNQKRYVDAIDQHTIVFGIGPAGTGKTYLAMAKAVAALQAKQVNRIILTRPAVEAGERLGFLPGTLNDKIDPYLRPALRRPARHGLARDDPQAHGVGHHRGRAAGLHAWTLAQRRVHHPRRGAEHLERADEDVPHPPGLRLEDGRHRRHHPGRPARWHPLRPQDRARHPRRRRGHPLRRADVARRRPAPTRQRHRRRLRTRRRAWPEARPSRTARTPAGRATGPTRPAGRHTPSVDATPDTQEDLA